MDAMRKPTPKDLLGIAGSFGQRIHMISRGLEVCPPVSMTHLGMLTPVDTNGVLEKITSSISTSLDVRPDVQIFKRPKNREDGSKFDDFRTK